MAELKTVTIKDQAYEFYPWEVLGQDVFDLCKAILADGKKYDRIIALAKGGLTFSRSMVDYLGVDNLSSIQVEFYSGINSTNKTPVVTQSLPVSIKNERILIFDDILDSGETILFATEYLKYHGVKSIDTAVLIEKPWAKHKVTYVTRKTEAWIIFPNESRESLEMLSDLWKKAGDDQETIKKQLLEVGFPKDEVALFASLE